MGIKILSIDLIGLGSLLRIPTAFIFSALCVCWGGCTIYSYEFYIKGKAKRVFSFKQCNIFLQTIFISFIFSIIVCIFFFILFHFFHFFRFKCMFSRYKVGRGSMKLIVTLRTMVYQLKQRTFPLFK